VSDLFIPDDPAFEAEGRWVGIWNEPESITPEITVG
jgi:hypothetical protein